ncbi:MAG: hypothetical protein H6710_17235 [Myxococcales bacterium]|nr:hypothetical protein [Myxococcales bacterium]
MPSAVTVDVSSTTVPSGYALAASGDGAWTSNSASSLSGVFSIQNSDIEFFDFSVSLIEGGLAIARADPRLIIRKINSEG